MGFSLVGWIIGTPQHKIHKLWSEIQHIAKKYYAKPVYGIPYDRKSPISDEIEISNQIDGIRKFNVKDMNLNQFDVIFYKLSIDNFYGFKGFTDPKDAHNVKFLREQLLSELIILKEMVARREGEKSADAA
tara:strand:- start:4233 stop:4625 length:393 start_codon:yes stop_codon:yes gene_type:complete